MTDATGLIDSVTARFAEICHLNPKAIRKLHLNIFSLCRNLKKIYRAFNRKLPPEVYRESFQESEQTTTKHTIPTIMFETMNTNKSDFSPHGESEEELEEIYQKFVGDGDYIKIDVPEDLIRYSSNIEKKEEEEEKKITHQDTQKDSLHASGTGDVGSYTSPFMKVALTKKSIVHSPKSPSVANTANEHPIHIKSYKHDISDPLQLSDRENRRKKINYDNIAFSIQYKLRIKDHIFRGIYDLILIKL